MTTPIRLGVIGLDRGASLVGKDLPGSLELAAACERQARLRERFAEKHPEVPCVESWEALLAREDVDAILLANHFHEHTSFAIEALEAGKHVLSECTTCFTLAEGVALVEAVEASGKTYMLAENYPSMAHNQEIRRLFEAGELGRFVYGECEYVHPVSAEAKNRRSVGWDHWRNWIPGTYYCTHSIAPLMLITGTRPVMVLGFINPYDPEDPSQADTAVRRDAGSVLMLKMDNGAYAKAMMLNYRGHGNHTRIHGSRGLAENLRVLRHDHVRFEKTAYDNDGVPVEQVYKPPFPRFHAEAGKAGHGGGDFLVMLDFAEAIKSGRAPELDVHAGVTMSACAIQGWRSCLDGCKPYPVPDFRDPTQRDRYRDDHWSPAPGTPEEFKAPNSVLGEIDPGERGRKAARKVWEGLGWEG